MQSGQIPAPSREVRRLKIVQSAILALSVSIVALCILFGNSSRTTVDRLNLVLLPLVAIMLGVTFYSLRRFRRACIAWQNEQADRSIDLH